MTRNRLRIGSRGSELALWQAHYVAAKLDLDAEIVIIKTTGDRLTQAPLDQAVAQGFFTKEIESALLAHEVDVAVHSYKDLPIGLPSGLEIGAVPVRGPAGDMLVGRRDHLDINLPWGLARNARVGTSSPRRRAQLLARRGDLEVVAVRGNVPTRIERVLQGDFDAVLLAQAGVARLALADAIAARGGVSRPLEPSEMCPAPAQGALAVEIRSDDAPTRQRVAALHDPATALAVDIERLLLARFGGGCQLPLGAYCTVQGKAVHLRAVVASTDGSECFAADATETEPKTAVERVYASLVAAGAAP